MFDLPHWSLYSTWTIQIPQTCLFLKTLHRPPYIKWFEKCPGSWWRFKPTGLFYSPHTGWASTFRCLPHEFFKAWCPLCVTYQQTTHAIPWVFLVLHVFHLTNPLNCLPNQDSLRVNYLGVKELNPNQSRGHLSTFLWEQGISIDQTFQHWAVSQNTE